MDGAEEKEIRYREMKKSSFMKQTVKSTFYNYVSFAPSRLDND